MQKEWTYFQRVASIGLFAGFFWSSINYLLYLINLTKVGPALVMLPWALPEWKNTYIGHLTGIVAISILSLAIAFLYSILLSRWESMWIGALFGIGLWFLVFFILHPIFPGLDQITAMDNKTLTTTICIYLLYGVFVGYSISYEYNEMTHKAS
ncbi:YqhR family membrane protein [Alteribacillus iranensis]|uniref:Conserved membrane protein YqhR n=1 Tax=Alteribacillus iranensis TaxID=930128 RepID=A0A1I1ZGA4_9BACI|nr:YqhR family membrane protein [Alteribacillus iranensis]SFE30786.1 Conserved membrane protein YqhR [Alteribacillus iranensis]